MSAGRTSWWPKDAAWHRRELIVELGEEFGAEGPAVIDVLCAWAQEQRSAGIVRGGFRTLAREAFVTVSHAQSILARATEIGVLDDLEVDPDGRRFTCRVSGWKADQDRGRAAVRQADKRNPPVDSGEQTVTDRSESRSVTRSALPNLTTPEKEKSVGGAREAIQAVEVSAVLAQCPRLHVDRIGVENAIAAWPHGDALQAAHEVVTWATDPAFQMTNAARALTSALSKQQQRQQQQPARAAYARRGAQTGTSAEDFMRIARGEA